jgi:ElaB/YqjD/DUF883 family membrane-anchored ribosome-binding protein
MRKEQEIANEIEVRRANLEHDIGKLRELVDDKLDVVRRAREQVEVRRDQLLDLRDNTRRRIVERPFAAVGLAFAIGALLGFMMRGR